MSETFEKGDLVALCIGDAYHIFELLSVSQGGVVICKNSETETALPMEGFACFKPFKVGKAVRGWLGKRWVYD